MRRIHENIQLAVLNQLLGLLLEEILLKVQGQFVVVNDEFGVGHEMFPDDFLHARDDQLLVLQRYELATRQSLKQSRSQPFTVDCRTK